MRNTRGADVGLHNSTGYCLRLIALLGTYLSHSHYTVDRLQTSPVTIQVNCASDVANCQLDHAFLTFPHLFFLDFHTYFDGLNARVKRQWINDVVDISLVVPVNKANRVCVWPPTATTDKAIRCTWLNVTKHTSRLFVMKNGVSGILSQPICDQIVKLRLCCSITPTLASLRSIV